ncbi:acyl-CoA thioesterase II [Microvirga sp. W0021]|uniref:Acyl-CoA thioesterase II n=1 Tax=Hohaiivirga grylli TaxID=3133970 RepID=A0ABV0BH03_9HYPH
MFNSVDELLSILKLEQLELNLYRGQSPQVGWQRVFGGQVVSQSLVAATHTVNSQFHVHSLHGNFILPGDPTIPIIYEVERLRDGHSFITRRITAIQHGQAIFSMSASYQKEEQGYEHQLPMPTGIPTPDTLPNEEEFRTKIVPLMPPEIRSYFARMRPLDIRPVDPTRYELKSGHEPYFNCWFKTVAPLPDDPAIHRAVLAYASDFTLLDSSLVAHGRSVVERSMQAASLDHAVWFHRSFRADEWLLYAQDSPSAMGARGFSRGLIYKQDGTLVASVAQEGLIRRRDDRL